MRSRSTPLLSICHACCACCVLLCLGCSGRRVLAQYEGFDPQGRRVEVALFVPPFTATTPVCLTGTTQRAAELAIDAQLPGASGRSLIYLARRHYSQCGADKFASAVYWESRPQGPQVCFYRETPRNNGAPVPADTDIVGAWDYCTLLHPYRE